MTGLPAARVAELRAAALADKSPFVDPVVFRQAQRFLPYTPDEWRRELLGRDERVDFRWMAPWEMDFLMRAHGEDRAWLDAVRAREQEAGRARMQEQAARTHAAWQAEWDAWEGLRARLPVPVFVGHNWTTVHEAHYVSGRDHIVVQAELHAGRLHRAARAALCETPATARSGTARKPNPLGHLEREPSAVSDPKRIPTCRGCLRVAERIARPE